MAANDFIVVVGMDQVVNGRHFPVGELDPNHSASMFLDYLQQANCVVFAFLAATYCTWSDRSLS